MKKLVILGIVVLAICILISVVNGNKTNFMGNPKLSMKRIIDESICNPSTKGTGVIPEYIDVQTCQTARTQLKYYNDCMSCKENGGLSCEDICNFVNPAILSDQALLNYLPTVCRKGNNTNIDKCVHNITQQFKNPRNTAGPLLKRVNALASAFTRQCRGTLDHEAQCYTSHMVNEMVN